MTNLPAALASETPTRRREISNALAQIGAFVYLHHATGDGAVFSRRGNAALPVCRLSRDEIEALHTAGTIREIGKTSLGCRYVVAGKDIGPSNVKSGVQRSSSTPARTAADRRKARFLQAERYFKSPDDPEPKAISVNLGESPLGWLSKRKDAEGRPFLSEEAVAAGERLRMDFERAQLGPNVTQDWRRFLTAGATAGTQNSGMRDVDGGADAARKRVMAALDDLGPDLGDAVFRTCCFLEGLESVERALNWSARSGKIVLRIALHRLSAHYERCDRPKHRQSSMFQKESAA